jgi:AbiJ N-terminal domain 3/Abortive infection C-terminus
MGCVTRATPTISRESRREILDTLAVDQVNWSGRLDEPSFLGRIWDLSTLRSNDFRFDDAEGDIWQHRVNNPEDWDDDWIFFDERFGLESGDDQTFVRFLCEMLHPLVRPDRDEVDQLLSLFNECLEGDGWEIIAGKRRRSGPVFEARRHEAFKKPTESLAVERHTRLDDPDVVREHLRRIERDLTGDPAGAIGSSKELLESVMKQILDDYSVDYKGADLGAIYKKVQKELRLNAEAVPDNKRGSEAAVQTLRALVSAIQALAELRNAIGSGHGRNRRSPALTRHARLAFNASVTVVEFLLDTWHVRRESSS